MLKSRTVFSGSVFREAKPRFESASMAWAAKKIMGVPWASEIKQLDASGRILGLQVRNTMK